MFYMRCVDFDRNLAFSRSHFCTSEMWAETAHEQVLTQIKMSTGAQSCADFDRKLAKIPPKLNVKQDVALDLPLPGPGRLQLSLAILHKWQLGKSHQLALVDTLGPNGTVVCHLPSHELSDACDHLDSISGVAAETSSGCLSKFCCASSSEFSCLHSLGQTGIGRTQPCRHSGGSEHDAPGQ